MEELKKWKTLQSKLVFDHRWCKVRRDEVELSNGEIVDDYFVNVRPDIALVFPVTAHQEVIFVRQYRHGVREILLELPAGAFDPTKERPESAAMRELQEETGYVSQSLIQLGILYDNPVKDTNKIHLFMAQNLSQRVEQALDLTEEIEVVLIPISEVMKKILEGKICVSGTIAAVFLGLNFMQQSQ